MRMKIKALLLTVAIVLVGLLGTGVAQASGYLKVYSGTYWWVQAVSTSGAHWTIYPGGALTSARSFAPPVNCIARWHRLGTDWIHYNATGWTPVPAEGVWVDNVTCKV